MTSQQTHQHLQQTLRIQTPNKILGWIVEIRFWKGHVQHRSLANYLGKLLYKFECGISMPWNLLPRDSSGKI